MFAGFLLCFCYVLTITLRSTMQVLQPQGLFINKPFYTSIHKHCFYTSPAFKQALLLHKSVFTQDLLLHKPCFYTSAVFTQALLLHKTCFYTNAVFTQALSLHKHCLYTRPAFTQKRFYTRPPFTQTLSLHKLCLYTSIACIQALLLHNDILLTKAFCNLQTGNRLEGRRNAEGCKYGTVPTRYLYHSLLPKAIGFQRATCHISRPRTDSIQSEDPNPGRKAGVPTCKCA